MKFLVSILKLALMHLFLNIIDIGSYHNIRKDVNNFYCYNVLKVNSDWSLTIKKCPFYIYKNKEVSYCVASHSSFHKGKHLILLGDYCKECD